MTASPTPPTDARARIRATLAAAAHETLGAERAGALAAELDALVEDLARLESFPLPDELEPIR